jgi:TolA-binding protein
MTVPEPSDSELALRLIRAGMRETPAPGTLQRTLAGLGLAAGALGTASSAGALAATKAAASVTAAALLKWAGAGAAAGVLFAASAHGVYRATHPEARGAHAAAPTRATTGAATLAASARPYDESPTVAATSAPVAFTPAPRAPRSAPESTETEAPLAAEVAFVDAGREAFQRGDFAAALARLDGYERAFPEQRLLPEVLYLRMQALVRRGEADQAAELAKRLVRDFPKSPHASSARAILTGDGAR